MLRLPGSRERHFRLRAQDRDRRAELVGSVRHEPPHVLHRALDRRGGFADQEVAPAADEQQRRQRRDGEGCEQGGVFFLELHAVSDDRRDVPGTGCPREPLGIEPELAPIGSLDVAVPVLRRHGLSGRFANPVRCVGGLDRPPALVEEVERTIGNVQLVDRVHDGAARSRALRFADAGSPFERSRRRPQRAIEVPRHLLVDRNEQSSPEQHQDQRKYSSVPCRELEAQPRQGLHHRTLIFRTGNQSRATW